MKPSSAIFATSSYGKRSFDPSLRRAAGPLRARTRARAPGSPFARRLNRSPWRRYRPARLGNPPLSAMISLRGVSLVYPNGVRALDNVNLEIAKGDFVFLVGDSGTGKSSLLRLLYREARSTTGEIVVDGIRVDRLRRNRIPALRRHLGVVFQDFKLLVDKTVWENVAFAMQVTGAHTRDVMRQVPRVLDLVGLSHKSRMYPGRALRRRAATDRHRARAGQQSQDSALRRADRKSRPGEHDRDHCAAAAHQPERHDRRRGNAQSGGRRSDAPPRRAPRRRPHHRR